MISKKCAAVCTGWLGWRKMGGGGEILRRGPRRVLHDPTVVDGDKRVVSQL